MATQSAVQALRLDFGVATFSRGGRSAPARVLTLVEFSETWLAGLRQRQPRTIESYRGNLERHVLPRLGAKPIDEITPEDVTRLYADLHDLGYRPWTVYTILSVLRTVFRAAMRRGVVSVSPFSKVDRWEFSVPRRTEPPMLSREEIGRLLRAAPESYRDLLATAIFTGLRQSELLAMRWENVDFARGLVRVRTALNRNRQHVPLKTRTSRRDVVLAPALAEQLQVARERSRYPLPSDYVFASKVGTPLHWRNISRRALQPALADAGLPHLRWHDLRHIYASMLIASGANVIFASRQLGRWSPEVTFRVYSHLFEMTEQADHTRSLVEDLYQHRMGTERASASSQARPKGPLAPASRCS